MACASLQIQRQTIVGPRRLRPIWRTVFWSLTKLPARLEAMHPPPPAVLLAVHQRAPEQVTAD